MNAAKQQTTNSADPGYRQSVKILISKSKTISFVTCDDPNGVVECGAIRKLKSSSRRMEHKIDRCTPQQNSHTFLDYRPGKEDMVSKGIVEECHKPSSLQLLKVSRGAQKLNQMIDSWSMGLSYDGQSKDISKDLLKGALDLQESLITLGKLQETSQYMARVKKKQEEKLESRRLDEIRSQRANSCQCGGQNCQMKFLEPQLSADGSSNDCIEELKKAITEGLARQNLLPNKSSQEDNFFDRRNMDSGILSTSSSQSSAAQSSHSHFSESSMLQTAPLKKGNGLNLIAKLMGLEDAPSKPLLGTPQKQLDVEKNVSQRRPVFDIDMPKGRKPHHVRQKVDSEQRTLKEILENMQFKGLLKRNSGREHELPSHPSNYYYSKQKVVDDMQPIVLIKPIRVSCPESEEAFEPMAWERRALNAEMVLRKKKVEEWVDPHSINHREVTFHPSKMHYKTEAECRAIKKLTQEGPKINRKVVEKPELIEVKTVDQKEGALHSSKMHRKVVEETSVKKVIKEEATAYKVAIARAGEKEVKTKLKDPSKIKSPTAVTHQQQKKEAVDKKGDKIQKVAAASRKTVEREIAKPKNVSRSQDHDMVPSIKLRKPENRSTVTNKQISGQCHTSPKIMSRNKAQSTIHNFKDRKNKEKPVREPTAAKPTTEDLLHTEEEKSLRCDNEDVLNGTITAFEEKPSRKNQENASDFQIEDHQSESQSPLCNEILLVSEPEKVAKLSEKVDNHSSHTEANRVTLHTGSDLKALLLSSSSFVTRVDERFHLDISCPKISPTCGISNFGEIDVKLSLDCAHEFIERGSLLDSQSRYAMLILPAYAGNSRIGLSLNQLTEEVCDGLETVRSYYNHGCDKLPTDSLHTILERDMNCNPMVSGIWDLGWTNGFSVNEAEEAVNGIEKLLVSELIEEVFT